MGGHRTWQRDEPVTRVAQVISVAHYSEDQIKQEVARLKGEWASCADHQLTEAANAWANVREKLEDVQDTLRQASEQLAQAWSSQASTESQHALMLLHDTARDLGSTAHQVSDFTGTSAQLMRHMLANAPSDRDPGAMEALTGSVGAGYGRSSPVGLIPGVDSSTLSDVGRSVYELPGKAIDNVAGAFGIGNDRTAEYQAALETLNQGYVAESWRMPSRVTAELPQIESTHSSEERRRIPDRLASDDPLFRSGMSPGAAPGEPPPSSPGHGGPSPPLEPGSPPLRADDLPIPDTDPAGGLAGTGGVGSSTGVGPAGVGPADAGPGGAGSRPGGGGGGTMMPLGAGGTGSGGTGNGGSRRGSPGGTGHPRPTGSASNAGGAGRAPGGRPGVAGAMPVGSGGRADEGQRRSRDTWLVEDDSPFTVDEIEPLPGVIR